MPPHLRGNHAGCAASHEGIKHNAAFWTTGEKTGLNQLRRVGGVVTALERDGVDLPDVALVAERIEVTVLDLTMLTGAVDGLRLRLTGNGLPYLLPPFMPRLRRSAVAGAIGSEIAL